MKKRTSYKFTKNLLRFIALTVVIYSCTESNLLEGIRDVKFKATVNRILLTEGETAVYKDSSIHVASREWIFEGGSITGSDQEEVSVTYPNPSPFLNINGTRGTYGFPTTLKVVYDDNTTESNTFKVKVYPKVEPSFKVDLPVAEVNTEVQYTDTTIEGQSSFAEAKEEDTIFWEFEGGTPATSTLRNPRVKYATAGKYSVKSTVKRSVPNNTGITTIEDFITIQDAIVPCVPSATNLVSCGNFNGETADLSKWSAVFKDFTTDRSANLSVSNTIFAPGGGSGSVKYKYDEAGPGVAGFTDVNINYEAEIDVTTAGSYTLTLDHYGVITGGTEYVFNLGFVNVDKRNVFETGLREFKGRYNADTWNNASVTKNLPVGKYFVRLAIFNPGFSPGQNIDLHLDNVKVVKN
ncbi:hypothetical protein [Polaribacter porphyrae]|uniref:PKD domain-containing protein n=1 Tax=Polaribacter porphyrae TaxID=1137780 RepID=A0A2S7WSS0_9FLAO|nr:hypothetical protein [Polaribacter porphyrae]PQJ80633.1 hypothetical protein BTO18_16265 [Polaribacter porphyrae]